ncbi:MAG: MCE family protein [Thermoleophilaceae bacterium]|nr:MCE family protein [Thermoleophilaceae bacterium]
MTPRVIVTILVSAALGIGALVLTAASEGELEGKRYRVVFDNVFGLVEGGDVKVGGVTGGTTEGFALTKDEPRRVVVEINISEPGFQSLREDAECGVRQQSLIGEYFVDCDLGTGDPLPAGGTVPVEQTSSTIPVDLVQNVMRLPYRERFRLILSELGTGLAGRPDDLNEVIRRAHPGLRETSETFKILADQNRSISRFIRDSDTVAAAVAPEREQLSRWATEASETATIQASREQSIAEQWRDLPIFLGQLRPTLAQLEDTAGRQIPLLDRLRSGAPELRRFISALRPFAEAARDSNRGLSDSTRAGREALRESGEEVATLRDLAEDAPKLGEPLRQFLQALDDRERSTEDDPLAAALGPPKPDKTAYREGQGLTGMEAFWNYIYHQTLATNVYDEVSHLLRIVLLRDSKCSPYSANPSESDIAQCGSFLGPYQPGLSAAKGEVGRFDFGPADPDPTERPSAKAEPARSRAQSDDGDGRASGARSSGADKRPSAAGERPSAPQENQETLPAPEESPSPAPDGLLDFLLAP